MGAGSSSGSARRGVASCAATSGATSRHPEPSPKEQILPHEKAKAHHEPWLQKQEIERLGTGKKYLIVNAISMWRRLE
jgi:hypothetical protein